MAAFALTLIGLIVIAAPPSRRLAGVRLERGRAMAIYAATSVAYPDDASSAVLRTEPWIVLSLAWSVLFLVVAERSRTDRRGSVAEALPRGRVAMVRRVVRQAFVVGGASVALLMVAALWSLTDTPRIPHQVSQSDRTHCASCHFDGVNDATGRADVPMIDERAHPQDTPPGSCVGCHSEGGFLEVEGAMTAEVVAHRPVAMPFGPPDTVDIEALRAYETERVSP